MLSLGWFSTGRGPGSRGLLSYAMSAIARGELDARIAYVFCNREPGEHAGSDQFMALARGYGLPLVTFSSRRFRREHRARVSQIRAEHDRRILDLVSPYHIDLCVLAGYMLIVSGELCSRLPMVNLHPALPGGPTGTWQEVIWKLLGERAAETGAMVHLVTEALDEGPAISYTSFAVRGPSYDVLWSSLDGQSVDDVKAAEGEDLPLFKAIRAEGVQRECPLLLETLIALAKADVRVHGGRVTDARGDTLPPLCLNDAVQRRIGTNVRARDVR
ncbi:MAG: hypothetical protein FJ315_02170 [SAR202 cluster bacterium]|nr:hypothetical protein [SAR202 cluster bacterium]